MLADANALDFIFTTSESAALALEATLISEFRPKYNVLLKDDRRHPYAVITFSEEYPRVIISRTRRARRGDRIYGPFVEEHKLRRLLTLIHTVFPLRQRKRPLFKDRPCINYDLGRCPGVCQQLVTPEEYSKTIANVDKLLSGRVTEVLSDMRNRMQHYSDAMEYEQAAAIRDKIASLETNFLVDTVGTQLIDDQLITTDIVAKDAFACRDVFAIATGKDHAKTVLFQIRGGKVTSRLVFSVEAHGQPAGELLDAVISCHYGAVTHPMEIPEEVVVCPGVPDRYGLRRLLSEKRGKKVKVRETRGRSGVAKIVWKNADIELNVEAKLKMHIARDLRVLADTLRPYCSHGNKIISENVRNFSSEEPGDTQNRDDLDLSRIECFDISHTSGSNAVGSMAVFVDGQPAPSEYRRYHLDARFSYQGHPDDFESIRETLRRRLRHFSEGVNTESKDNSRLPSLLVIDGGKGQLGAACEVLENCGLIDVIPVVSIAKGEEAVFAPSFADPINYDADTDSCVLNDGVRLLCRIRDEAHRAAITAHRVRRGREALKSGLDSIPGLGAKKRGALLDHFKGSSEAVAAADRTQLMNAAGIGPALADRIFNHFHSTNQGHESGT